MIVKTETETEENRLHRQPTTQACRGAKPIDLIAYGIALLVAIVVAIWLSFHQGYFVVKGFIIVGLSILTCYYFKKWKTKPTFVTKHGVSVWTNNITDIDQELMELALDHFTKVLCEEGPSEVTGPELRSLLTRIGIEWRKYRCSRVVTPKHDAERRNHRLWIWWPGSIAESSLYHELLHEVNEFIRMPTEPTEEDKIRFWLADIRHEDANWWRLEGVLGRDF